MKPDQGEKKAVRITSLLEKSYGPQRTALDFGSPFELLVAVILSAQCTDDRVNQVAPVLFARYPTAESLAEAPIEDIEAIVRPTGFYRNKARSIKGTAEKVMKVFGGQVPRTMAEMLELPGVARKTANVVLTSAYGVIEGIVVDTHVKRVAKRLGLTNHDDPAKVEQDLMAVVPRDRWGDFALLLITHGRKICQARKPRCIDCPLCFMCPWGSSRLEGLGKTCTTAGDSV